MSFAILLLKLFTLLVLQKPVKTSAAEETLENCNDLYNTPCTGGRPDKFDYSLDVKCINDTVFVSYDPKTENIGLVTMQYTCYNGLGVESTIVFAPRSEKLSETHILSNNLFSKGLCQFTGCAKIDRKQCWQYINVTRNISCAQHSNSYQTLSSSLLYVTPSSSLTSSFSSRLPHQFAASYAFATILPSQSLPLQSLSSSLQSFSTSSFQSLSSTSSVTNLPTKKTSLKQSQHNSHQTQSTSLIPPGVNANEGADNSITSTMFLPVVVSVGFLTAMAVSLFVLILFLLVCKRFSKKTNSNPFFFHETMQVQEVDGNIYVANLEKEEHVNANGSVLTLVQPLNFTKWPSAHHSNTSLQYEVVNPCMTRSTQGDTVEVCYSQKEKDCPSQTLNSLSNSLSLPESMNSSGSTAIKKEGLNYSSQTLAGTNCYLTFEDPRSISEASSSSHSSLSSQSETEVFAEGEMITSHRPVPTVGVNHCSTSSSGYVSTSPSQENSFKDMNDCFNQGYIHYTFHLNNNKEHEIK